MEDEGMDRLQATKKELAKSYAYYLHRLWLPLYLLVYGREWTIYGLFSHNAFCRGLFVVCSHLFNLVSQFMDINEKILTKDN
jgi:hypothetical protein